MIRLPGKYALLMCCFILAVFLASCSKDNKKPVHKIKEGKYSVLLQGFSTPEAAGKSVDELKSKIKDSLAVIQFKQKSYGVKIGIFPTSFAAGKRGFNLFLDSLISSYMIVKDDSVVFDEFNNVIFAARYEDIPSIYNFDLQHKKYSLSWYKWGNRVFSINRSWDNQKAFIAAAVGMGWKGGFPYILDAKIYLYDRASNNMQLLTELGKGVQLFTSWQTDDTFRVNFTDLDTFKTSLLTQKIFKYDPEGKLERQDTVKYDLLKDGFPLPPAEAIELNSPDGRYTLEIKDKKNSTEFYVKDNDSDDSFFAASSKRKLYNAVWSDDSRFLFMVTTYFRGMKRQIPDNAFSELIVYDCKSQKAQRKFDKSRYKNFMLRGGLLIFDEGFGDSSKIIFYDYVRDIIYYTLAVPGGCGINSIPL